MLEVKTVCPLGVECEEAKGQEIHRCAWYINVRGKDPQSEDIIDKWVCSLSILPALIIENAQTNRGQTSAIESFRNEMVKSQNVFNNILINNAKKREKQLSS
jgi:hypothetical protein